MKTYGMCFLQVVMPTAEADVAFGLGNLELSQEEVRDRVMRSLEAVGMSEYLQVKKYIHSFSIMRLDFRMCCEIWECEFKFYFLLQKSWLILGYRMVFAYIYISIDDLKI